MSTDRDLIVLEPARRRDAARIARMSRDSIERGLGWQWHATRVLRTMRSEDVLTVVARAPGDRTVGFALMKYGEANAHLLLLAVDPSARRRGVGRALVQWHLSCCRTAGIRTVELEVRANNVTAIRFYEALGFERARTVAGYYQGREDALMMRLHLVPPSEI